MDPISLTSSVTTSLESLFNINALSQLFSSNVYVSGIIMLLLNVGTSYLMQDLMPIAHRIFSSYWVRRLVFFAIFFTATRDLRVSILMTILFTLLVDLFLNEESEYCLIPYENRTTKHLPPETNASAINEEKMNSVNNRNASSTQTSNTKPEMFIVPGQISLGQNKSIPSTSRLETFKKNAELWSLSHQPVSFW